MPVLKTKTNKLKNEESKMVESQNEQETGPIHISDLHRLQFENMKLKIDMLNMQKYNIEKDLNEMSESINRKIIDTMKEMDIPNQYKLDFSTFTFIIPSN